MKEFYFHEDFYCQVQLLPLSALDSSLAEMNQIADFSDAHWDGTAWTALYLREDHTQHLKSLGIPVDSVAAVLDSILEPVAKVYTGYSTYREPCKNTRAWVLPGGTALLADFDEAGIIERLWIIDERPAAENLDQFQQALQALDQFGDFFIADWNIGIAVACNDEDKLRRYLSGSAPDL
jgi:hypothetical protein